MTADEVEEALHDLTRSMNLPGLKGIMVSDRDCVTILSTLVPAPSGHDSPTPQSGAASRSIPIEAGFAVIADQVAASSSVPFLCCDCA